MRHRRPPQAQRRAGAFTRPLSRRPSSPSLGAPGREGPFTLPLPRGSGAFLGRTLYCLLHADGAACSGLAWQGCCLLLFTSAAAANDFADACHVPTQPPLIFSRSRAEFLMQARRCFAHGFIGGLIDPGIGIGKTEFLGFDTEPH